MFWAEKWCAKAKGRPDTARRALNPEDPRSQIGGRCGEVRRRGGELDGARDRVDAGVGVTGREVVVQEAGQLRELLGEVVGALVETLGAAEGGGGGASVPGARPRPRSTRPGAMASSVPNCSAITRGAWFGSITPPEPRRMRVVWAARWARITAGEEEATPGMEWCSATQ